MKKNAPEREPGDAAQPPKLDRAALAALAPDARQALETLRRSPRPRRTATGREACEPITVRLKVVTPILGGGPKLRQLDDIDIIRVPTVRGHLRFWWRALYGHLYDTPQKLYEAESALWGRPADDNGGRSEVEVSIPSHSPHRQQDIDDTNPLAQNGAYALWPARVQGAPNNGSHLPRRRPDTVKFTLRVVGPKNCEHVLRNTIRAWILFGGYGSRTRRGLGSLTLDGDDQGWLPTERTGNPQGFRAALTELFSMDVFAAQPRCPTMEVPLLGRASLFVGNAVPATVNNPDGGAWITALGWLRDFRQGVNTGARRRPAEDAPEPRRPSISNWPEADVWRSIQAGSYSHSSRYAGQRAYPRAGFGLPIQTRFQTRARGGGSLREPDDFTLYWHDGHNERDRFGSALIVKAFPLRGNMFAPCALWLTRTYPANAKVVPRGTNVARTGAPFDANYIAHPDAPEFVKTSGVDGLREAFANWLYYDAPAQLRQTILAIST